MSPSNPGRNTFLSRPTDILLSSLEILQGRERTGVVRIHGQRVELEVSPEITPSIDWVEQEDGSWAGTSLATRFDKLTVRYLATPDIAAIHLWLSNG